MKVLHLLWFTVLLSSCASNSSEEGEPTIPDRSTWNSAPAFLQDDDPINKHQQYMGAGFQNQ